MTLRELAQKILVMPSASQDIAVYAADYRGNYEVGTLEMSKFLTEGDWDKDKGYQGDKEVTAWLLSW